MESHILGFPASARRRRNSSSPWTALAGRVVRRELADWAGTSRRATGRSSDAGPVPRRGRDFSFYDHVLDTALLLGLIPERFADGGAVLSGPLFPHGPGDAEKNVPAWT
jgi:5-methyltetrahydropteroyltriglutamate--homocysteine methyltransferase